MIGLIDAQQCMDASYLFFTFAGSQELSFAENSLKGCFIGQKPKKRHQVLTMEYAANVHKA